MALVQRGNKFYLYRSVRRGGRVTSEYRGSGETARLINTFEIAERDEADYDRYCERKAREQFRELETDLDKLTESARVIARDALIEAGYHNHKGEWRKKREQQHDRDQGERPSDGQVVNHSDDRLGGGGEGKPRNEGQAP